MKKTSFLPSRGGSVKCLRHILVFDDHPDSMRLILGPSAKRHAYHSGAGRARLRSLIFPGIAILPALVGLAWLLL
jgi:hypothetical protein